MSPTAITSFRHFCCKDISGFLRNLAAKHFFMRRLLVLPLLICTLAAFTQSNEAAIRRVMERQVESWNAGSLEAFMAGYWNSDSLLFVGKSGLTYGWQQTLNNYKKNYPDTAAMGKLAFDLLLVKELSPEYYYVVGKWMLTRSAGNLSGHFDVLFRKIGGNWVIVSDHSS
jgi:ketosteroid isomerase-like protein